MNYANFPQFTTARTAINSCTNFSAHRIEAEWGERTLDIWKVAIVFRGVGWPAPKSTTVPISHNRKVKCIHDHTKLLTIDALALLRQAEPVLKKRYGVAKIGIFGSFVRGEEQTESDVDVLVTFRKGQKTFENYMDCKFYLEDLFQRKVDLVLKNTIKTRLKPYILGEVVYA